MQGDELVMTQDLIANMLGVRRDGVTDSALKLQNTGLIRNVRGCITVLDRAGLEKRTCEYYAVAKKIRSAASLADCDLAVNSSQR
jgi:hypothetical protein